MKRNHYLLASLKQCQRVKNILNALKIFKMFYIPVIIDILTLNYNWFLQPTVTTTVTLNPYFFSLSHYCSYSLLSRKSPSQQHSHYGSFPLAVLNSWCFIWENLYLLSLAASQNLKKTADTKEMLIRCGERWSIMWKKK